MEVEPNSLSEPTSNSHQPNSSLPVVVKVTSCNFLHELPGAKRIDRHQPCNSNDTPLSLDGLQHWHDPEFLKVYLERQKGKGWMNQSNLSETDKKNWQDIRTWDQVCGPDEIIVKMGVFKKQRGYYSVKKRMFLYFVCKWIKNGRIA